MKKNRTNVLLSCTLLILIFGVFSIHNSQAVRVLAKSDKSTVGIKTPENNNEQIATRKISTPSITTTSTISPVSFLDENPVGTDNSVISSSKSKVDPIPVPVPSPKPIDISAIKGQIAIGPTCPVLRIDADGNIEPGCEDRPYSTEIVVKTEDGLSEVARTKSDENGYYYIILEPGTYIVIAGPQEGFPFPFQISKTVTIEYSSTTHVSFSLDSGIR